LLGGDLLCLMLTTVYFFGGFAVNFGLRNVPSWTSEFALI